MEIPEAEHFHTPDGHCSVCLGRCCYNEDYIDIPDYEDTLLPIHYKFRFTFTEQDKDFQYDNEIPRFKAIGRALVSKLMETYQITQLTGGFETRNKLGERTYAHIHLCFDAKEPKGTIVKLIKRFLGDTYSQNTSGVKTFSLKPELPRSMQLIYQYPLKQNLDYSMCRGFEKSYLDFLHEVAKASYAKTIEVHQAKADKRDNSDTLFERLCEFLNKSGETSLISLRIATSKFYVSEDRPLNKPVMIGYVDTYRLKCGLISHEDFWA